MNQRVVLIIMDGWGDGPRGKTNAIETANTPFIDSCYRKYPNTDMLTSGLDVGLPEGQMGNSEVGHLNMGAGRVVYQELVHINKAVEEHTLDTNPVLLDAFNYVKSQKKKLHFIGLVSKGGVHSHLGHLKGLCTIAAKNDVKDFYIHAFTDGRDCDPQSGKGFMAELISHLKITGGKVASIIGRYYAMDRDQRWERIQLAYDLLTKGIGKQSENVMDAITESYSENITDEFIKPVCITEHNVPVAMIENGDAVICFNFRTDRCREITRVLTQESFPDFGMEPLQLNYITMTVYDENYKNVKAIFEKDNLKNTLGEVLARAGKKQIRIAETEKYPHVTFFFSGGREAEFAGEKRIMIPSPKVATYDLQPAMSAWGVRDALLNELNKNEADFVCINFANTDMVGHTGVFAAAVEAAQTVDKCVGDLVAAGIKNKYSFLITADHGNAEYMINPDGSPNTAHTTNPVPLFLIEPTGKYTLRSGRLADLAPTVLQLMGIEKPAEMTGSSLLVS